MHVIKSHVIRLADKNKVIVGSLVYDDCLPNPCREFDYFLGTIATHPNSSHWANEEIDLSITASNPEDHMQKFISSKGLKFRDVVICPITKYQHRKVYLSLGDNRTCPFESGIVGFIYATKEDIRKYFNTSKVTKKIYEKTLKIFSNELEEMNAYINGDGYGFYIYEMDDSAYQEIAKNGLDDTEVNFTGCVIDSCCGYYNKEHAKRDMNDMLDHFAKKYAKAV